MSSFLSLSILLMFLTHLTHGVQLTCHPSAPYGGCTNAQQLATIIPEELQSKLNKIDPTKKLEIISRLADEYDGMVLFDKDATNCFKQVTVRSGSKTKQAIVLDICVGCYDSSLKLYTSLGGQSQCTSHLPNVNIQYQSPDLSVIHKVIDAMGKITIDE